jgi:hypothetical protein
LNGFDYNNHRNESQDAHPPNLLVYGSRLEHL